MEAPSGRVSMYAAQNARMALSLNFRVGDCDRGDQTGEQGDRLAVAEVVLLGDQIAGCGAEGEREQDGGPVERLTLGGVNRVDRQRLLARVPNAEGRQHQDGEDDRAGCERDVEVLDHVVGDQRANDAEQHHGHPVDGGDVLGCLELRDQRHDAGSNP